MKVIMPQVDVSNMEFPNLSLLSASQWRQIVNSVVKKNGSIRASKPTIKDRSDLVQGCAAYVWRMVVFQVMSVQPYCCMPVTADFDIPLGWSNTPGTHDDRRAMTKELDVIVDQIVNLVPVTQWKGILRWGSALGLI